jgi:hypothetical protein
LEFKHDKYRDESIELPAWNDWARMLLDAATFEHVMVRFEMSLQTKLHAVDIALM